MLKQIHSVEGGSSINSNESLTIPQMIVKLSSDQKDGLVSRLKTTLSIHLGDKIDSKEHYYSGQRAEWIETIENVPIKKGYKMMLTSLKDCFLQTPLFVDEIINDFQNEYTRLGQGKAFTWTLANLKSTHDHKKSICTTTPHLDPKVTEALGKIVKDDPDYVIGLEVDQAETASQGELVFAIFEKNGIMELSRTLISASTL